MKKNPTYSIAMSGKRKAVASSSSISSQPFDDVKRKYIISTKNGEAVSKSITHTRIGGNDENGNKIHGGKFHISPEDLTEFYRSYIDHVLIKGNDEYLTEKQLPNGDDAPILIDLDFRYPNDTEKRLYTQDTISDIGEAYLEQLKRIVMFEDDQTFPFFVFERDNMYSKYKDGELNAVKDGLHIIIGIKMPRSCQQLLRKYVMDYCKSEELLDSLGLVNDLGDVFDQTISAGTTGWQLYGSRKPGCRPYRLTHYWNIRFDGGVRQLIIDKQKVEEFLASPQIYDNFPLLSARYTEHVKVAIMDRALKEAQTLVTRRPARRIGTITATTTNPDSSAAGGAAALLPPALSRNCGRNVAYFTPTDYEHIHSSEELDEAIERFLATLPPDDSQIRDAHFIAQMLPEKYYKDGESHLENRLVAFALKNTSPDLFLSWIKVRSKADNFDFNEIPTLYDKWVRYFNVNGDANYATLGSLKYWAKRDAPQEYAEYVKTTDDYMAEDVISGYTEGKIARIMKHKYGDEYVCSDLDKKELYHFENHHWVKDDGRTLRRKISEEILHIFINKLNEAFAYQRELNRTALEDEDEDGGNQETTADPTKKDRGAAAEDPKARIKARIAKLTDICTRLDSAAPKNNCYNEALELFYDGEFNKMIDNENSRWLLCFKNGVLDLKNKIFREGQPTDYISKSVSYNYVPLATYEKTHPTTIQEIKTFMSQLFPIPSLEQYMWDHLGSVIIGEQIEQVFNLYVGEGSNGKSALTEKVMKSCLEEYYHAGDVAMITTKRGTASAATPERMELRGVRYCVFEEPDKGAPLTEGFVKELAGNKTMKGRALFSKPVTFTNQASYAVAMNKLFDVSDATDGIWRRIKVVRFHSQFKKPGMTYKYKSLYEFPVDPNLEDKLPTWAPVLMSMLVEIAFVNQGRVLDCEEVTKETNNYRQKEDVIQEFMMNKVGKMEGCQVGQQVIYRTFREWFNSIHSGEKMPKLNELEKAMNDTYGDRVGQPNNKWGGVYIIPDNEDEEGQDVDGEGI